MARVLLKCHDVVGRAMAGPAIRYWEFAKALSKKHQVTLQVPQETTLDAEEFRIVTTQDSLDYKTFDVLISQLLDPQTVLKAKKSGVRLIYDAYDPEPLEHLEIFKSSSLNTRIFLNQKIIQTVNFSLEMADGILCANQKQRDLWTGSLLSLKKIHPQLYDRDSSLDKLITVVPFGMSSKKPQKTKEGFRKLFNLKAHDKVLLWGGGIWNWFDPLTLISAMKALSEKRSDIKLIFMGMIHPNSKAIPAMSIAYEAKNLAQTFNLINHSIFFNEVWIPYEERENYLLEADVGVSTHFEHLETRYSFRTRILDYMWAGLPILSTQGDTFGELIEKHQLGKTVPPNNSLAIANAIEQLVDHPEATKKMKNNIEQLKNQFYWENIVQPLDGMIDFLANTGRSHLSFRELKKITHCVWRKLTPHVICKKLQIYLQSQRQDLH